MIGIVRQAVDAPFDYPSPEQLIILRAANVAKAIPDYPLSFDEYAGLRLAHSIVGLAADLPSSFLLSGVTTSQRIDAARLSGPYFETVGIRPLFGRTLSADDERGSRAVAIISERLWNEEFDRSPDVLSRDILLDGKAAAVVGVIPNTFRDPFGVAVDCWVSGPFGLTNTWRRNRGWIAIGRLRGDTSLSQANAELAAAHVDAEPGWTIHGTRLAQFIAAPWIGTLRTMLLAAIAILLVCLANTTILCIVREWRRRGEYALRVALGATQRRLIGDAATEAAIIAVMAFLLTTAVGRLMQTALVGIVPSYMPGVSHLPPMSGLLYAAIGCVVALVGISTSLQVTYTASIPARRGLETLSTHTTPGRTSRRFLNASVIVQIAATSVAVFVAAIALLGVRDQWQAAARIGAGDAVTARVMFRDVRYASAQAKLTYIRAGMASLASLPGAGSVAAAAITPFDRFVLEAEASAPGPVSRRAPITTRYAAVSPEFFGLFGLAALHGRLLLERDRAGGPIVFVVTESAARALWPESDPIGQPLEVRVINPSGSLKGDIYRQGEVVGVVSDVSEGSGSEWNEPTIYVPIVQHPMPLVRFIIKGHLSMLSGRAIRGALRAADPALPVDEVITMQSMVLWRTERLRFVAVLTVALAFVGLAFAIFGTYGVIRHLTNQRLREFAVRSALGATPGRVRAAVIGEGSGLLAAGFVLGAVATILAYGVVTRALGALSPGRLEEATWTTVAVIALPALMGMYRVTRGLAAYDLFRLLKEN